MKKRLLFISSFFVFTATAFSQVKYQYPVLPGTLEWKKFQTTAEMLKACQLPEEVLKSSSTEELLEICMDYPLLNQYTAHNSLYKGLKNIIEGFNGLQEFYKRSDAFDVLLKYYQTQNFSKINSIEGLEKKGAYTFELLRWSCCLPKRI